MRSAAFDGSRSDQSFPSRSTKKGRLPPGWLDIHTLGPIPTEGPQNVRISKGTRRSTPLDLDPWELCPHGAEDGLDRRLLERFCHCLSLSQPDLQPLKARTPEIERLPRPAPDRPIGSDVGSISDDDPLTLKREDPWLSARGSLAFSGEPGFASYASSSRLIKENVTNRCCSRLAKACSRASIP